MSASRNNGNGSTPKRNLSSGNKNQGKQGRARTPGTPTRRKNGATPTRNQSNTPGGGNDSPGRGRGTPRKSHDFKPFEPYYTLEEVSDGLKRGTLFKSVLRINQRSYEDAFIDSPDGYGDIHIQGMHSRNRALHGDEVIVQLLSKENWKVHIEAYKKSTSAAEEEGLSADMKNVKITNDVKCNSKTMENSKTTDCAGDPVKKQLFQENVDHGVIPEKFYQKFGKVVYISEMKHSRAAGGHLKPPTSKNAVDALFRPNDSRIPRMYIPVSDCPDGFLDRPDDFAKYLYIARITDWDCNKALPKGRLQRSLGEAGQIEPETEAILIQHDVDFSDFSEQVLNCLPQDEDWSIPQEELSKRKDLRKECIFTIDPATARDLDDALSCKPTDNGNFEVGVHIADVSYFIPEDSALDIKASERATSVYLVQKVIPMLPRLLCERLCSLNPYQDRLAFSFIWTMTPNGDIVNEWYGRTVIRSCVKLSYNHAQDMIDNEDKEFADNELPEISNNYTVNDVRRCVLDLNKIANCLRKKRFDEGALRLDQSKISFSLDQETGLPSGYSIYHLRDSNRLVEEFMLLANMAAAVKVYEKYPQQALLRRHTPPKEKMIDELVAMCTEMGLEIDPTSAGTLQESLQRYVGEDTFSKSRSQILVNLCSKPMQLATYFCTGMYSDTTTYRHYALNVPLYTHFTSPIRRYPDILVHRLLAAATNSTLPPTRESDVIQMQAKHCNERKSAAKRVQEMSAEIFLTVFVKECGPLEEDAMVMAVLDRSVDVLILSLGLVKRAYCNAPDICDKVTYNYSKTGKTSQLDLTWKADDENPTATKQVLKVFSSLKVKLIAADKDLKLNAVLTRPAEVVE